MTRGLMKKKGSGLLKDTNWMNYYRVQNLEKEEQVGPTKNRKEVTVNLIN